MVGSAEFFIMLRRVTVRVKLIKLLLRFRRRRKARGRRIWAELLFDSFATRAFGIRSDAPAHRQFLYRAGPYQIDVLIESAQRNRLLITGQLLDVRQPEILRRVRVNLWNNRKSFVTVRTNDWGEFLGEIEDSGELIVSLKVQMREIAISIRDVHH